MSQTSTVIADRYRLEQRIGTGRTGEVWRARDLAMGRVVAVKLVRSQYGDQPETLARLKARAGQAAGVAHHGVAAVYDCGMAAPPHAAYLVMELVDGPSLAGLLAMGALAPARAMDVIAQAAAALAAAHRADLLHRDIKPANLLLAPGGTVKITDFGLAHATGSAPFTLAASLTGVPAPRLADSPTGTPAYLAPECAAGLPASPASDLYSLGLVGYECLAGAPPFTGTPVEVVAAHRYRPLPPLPAGLPRGVAALIGELTAKDPAARPATACAVAARAERVRDVIAGGRRGTAVA